MTQINKKTKLNIITWNAQGILNKTNELEHLINTRNTDLIFIQETKINNNKPPKIKGYQSISSPLGQHRGLLTYYKNYLDIESINASPLMYRELELII